MKENITNTTATRKGGFSHLEIMIAVAAILLLAGIGYYAYGLTRAEDPHAAAAAAAAAAAQESSIFREKANEVFAQTTELLTSWSGWGVLMMDRGGIWVVAAWIVAVLLFIFFSNRWTASRLASEEREAELARLKREKKATFHAEFEEPAPAVRKGGKVAAG